MKTYFLYCACLAFVLSSFLGCDIFEVKTTDFTQLPPETQEGKHTFGCYIDGKLFVGGNLSNSWIERDLLIANYVKSTDELNIYTHGKINNEVQALVGFKIIHPMLDISQQFREMYYTAPDTSLLKCYCNSYSGKSSGELLLTKFDTINYIVSGRFNFIVECDDPTACGFMQKDTIHISQGRFDLRMRIFDN